MSFRVLSEVKPPTNLLPAALLVVRWQRAATSEGKEGTMTMSRRRGRREEDPEPDARNCAPTPGKKRRRWRRPSAVAVATLGATGDVDVEDVDDVTLARSGSGSATVVVSGLPSGCTVLELKSRMQMYGTISRIRIDGSESVGHVTYRSLDSARAAVSASVDPALGITIGSTKVCASQVGYPTQWHTGRSILAPSKLLRAELPLRKHGRGNKKLSEGMMSCNRSTQEMPYEGRQIVAYDDLL